MIRIVKSRQLKTEKTPKVKSAIQNRKCDSGLGEVVDLSWQRIFQFHTTRTAKTKIVVSNCSKSSKVALSAGILGTRERGMRHKLLFREIAKQAFCQN